MKHLGFASISALNQYLRYAIAKKINTESLLKRHDLLRYADLEEGRISGEQFQAFLIDLEKIADDPLFGLSSALYVKSHSYTILGKIVEQSVTLGDAIERVPVFERLVGDMGTTHIERGNATTSLTWECSYTAPSIIPHMIDNVLASWTLFARSLTKENASPEKVFLQRPRPNSSQVTIYERIFGAPVVFDSDKNCLNVKQTHLSLPVQTEASIADNGMGSLRRANSLEGKARASLASIQKADENLSESVSRAINAHLQLGMTSKELIAQEFSMSERNLQRKLASEGTSYRTLLDNARQARALRLLAQTNLTTTEIAYNLGYQDERCLFRSMKRWTKLTPQSYQKLRQT